MSDLNKWLRVIVELYTGKAPAPAGDLKGERDQALANAARVERAFRRAGGSRDLKVT